MNNNTPYDLVVIGSGLGGLLTALTLAQEGKKVCILEKNAQIGGTLQTFYFNKVKFDTGVHYIGGLDEGQPLHPYFKHFGILDNVKFEKMEEDGFDIIRLPNDPNHYPIAQGYDNFIEQLCRFFPEEREGLTQYVNKIKEVCSYFSFYNLGSEANIHQEMDQYHLSAKDVIEGCVSNEKLRLVLAANNMLYAGEGSSAPFYIHALINNSYIQSSYRVVGGGSKISRYLEKELKKLGAKLFRNSEVVKFIQEDNKITGVQTNNNGVFYGDMFVSNVHPATTFKWADLSGIRKSYIKRINQLENTCSAFIIYAKMKPKALPYQRVNYYDFSENEVWELTNYKEENWSKDFAIYSTPFTNDKEFTESAIFITYMKTSEVDQWKDSFHTVTEQPEGRGSSYNEFKQKKAQQFLAHVASRYPEIAEAIDSYDTSTPLTLRDYVGADGSLYGIKRDFNSPLKSYLNTKTKFPNLYLTGQNLVMHGVLGVTIGAMVTCSEILGKPHVVNKILSSNKVLV